MNKLKKKLVFITGAGISEESGVQVFRGKNGMWGDYDPKVVCSIEGWNKNPRLVQEFYNSRRKKLEEVEPNKAHYLCEEFWEFYDISIITTNVDNLHERAGSKDVLHIHGELTKSCDNDKQNSEFIGYEELSLDDFSRRPDIVFFGEDVPLMTKAIELVKQADVLVLIGTSLTVYPACNLLFNLEEGKDFIYIDTNATKNIDRYEFESGLEEGFLMKMYNLYVFDEKASVGLENYLSEVQTEV